MGLPSRPLLMNNASYTERQWKLANQVMDLVDQQRHAHGPTWTDEDRQKVVQLVLTTYQSQDIPADVEVIENALDVALRALPVDQEGLAPGPTPVKEAKTAVVQAQAHRLFHNRDLGAEIQAHGQYLQRQRLSHIGKSVGWFSVMGLMGVVYFFLLRAGSSPLVLLGVVGLFWVSWMGVSKPAIAQHMKAWQIKQLLNVQSEALAALDRAEYNNTSLVRWAQEVRPAIAFYSLQPLKADSYLWKIAAAAAEKEPALFRLWGQWLSSNHPIRECDAIILNKAAEAVQAAEDFLEREARDVQLQRPIRQTLLQR